jgi:hypothetical protein
MEEIAIQEIKSIVQASTLLSASEKQEWLDLCEVMNDEQLIELKTILLSVISPAKVSAPVLVPTPKLESKLPPLKHILNLPKREETRSVAPSQPAEKLKEPSKFWQKVKSVLAEKELPPGHQEPTKELELPEHASLPPTALAVLPKKTVEPLIQPKPAVKPIITPKPPILPKPTANAHKEEKLSEVVKSAVKQALKEVEMKPEKPVRPMVDSSVQSKISDSPEPILKTKPEPEIRPAEPVKPIEPEKSVQPSYEPVRSVPKAPATPAEPTASAVSQNSPIPQTVLKLPKLESLKVDKIVVNDDAYNEKSSYKVLKPEEIKQTILQEAQAGLMQNKDKLTAEPLLENVVEVKEENSEAIKSKIAEPAFVPGLANPNILAEAKLTPAKLKPNIINLPVAKDFEKLEEVATLTPGALTQDLIPALKHLIAKLGFFEVYTALEQSPLFTSYINSGLDVLAGKANFSSSQKLALNKEQFERFVDVLRGIKH